MCWKDETISLGLSAIQVTPKTPSVEPEQFVEENEDLQALGDNVSFELRLAETIEWCLHHADILEPIDSLRSEALKPDFLCNENQYLNDSAKRNQDLCQLLEKRSKLLSKEAIPVVTDADLQGGKLIAYFPDENFSDGASEAATMEFFDVDNVPPWDTWVGLFRDKVREYIVAYIPSKFVSLVRDGIEVNFADCVQWLEKSDTRLARKLLQKGIILKENY